MINIGGLTLDNITILAPLAGITNLPFRLPAKEAGCAMVCSEMISSNGLVYRSAKTLGMLDSLDREKPLSVQIFGSDPSIMAEAAGIVESSGAGLLDINFGCSVRKVIKTGSGAALMREPAKAEAIIKAVRKSVNIPLTIKIRTGWDKSGNQALETARMAEACGVNAIAIHPRTATQGFKGHADWTVISAIKQRVSIPVIGNGDIKKPEDALRMISETGCDAVMIGRAAIGNPWIFSEINALLNGNEIPSAGLADRRNMMLRYLEASVEYYGEKRACLMMRGRLGWFVKGLSFSSRFRESIKHISTRDEAIELIMKWERMLEGLRRGDSPCKRERAQ